MSRIGNMPIPVPSGVQVKINGSDVNVKGSHGELTTTFHADMKIFQEENVLRVVRPSDEGEHRALHGLTRSLLANMVTGVNEGFQKDLELVGVGYRVQQSGTGITLNVAFDYGGREEILEAVRQIIRDGVPQDQIDEVLFKKYLYTADTPDPDLIVRTGGELRLSNFLLWQSAYSEYYHTPVLWPDLDSVELGKALDSYKNRRRRFGNVSTNTPG